YDKIVLGPEFQDVPLLEKPIDLPAMAQKLAGLIAEPSAAPRNEA
ncbi:response regulator, partial [Herbaspirillum sp. HC18]